VWRDNGMGNKSCDWCTGTVSVVMCMVVCLYHGCWKEMCFCCWGGGWLSSLHLSHVHTLVF
jgi:hypothetical protein